MPPATTIRAHGSAHDGAADDVDDNDDDNAYDDVDDNAYDHDDGDEAGLLWRQQRGLVDGQRGLLRWQMGAYLTASGVDTAARGWAYLTAGGFATAAKGGLVDGRRG